MPVGRLPDTERGHGRARLVVHESGSDLVVGAARVPSGAVPVAKWIADQAGFFHAVPVRPSDVHRRPVGPHHHFLIYRHFIATLPVVLPARIGLPSRSDDTRVRIHFGTASVSGGPHSSPSAFPIGLKLIILEANLISEGDYLLIY